MIEAGLIKEITEMKKILDRVMPDFFKGISDPGRIDITNNIGISEGKILNQEEKLRIKEETGWSDEIVDSIGSMEEYEIYKNAGLHEEIVDGRPCLCKDIDMDYEYTDPKTGEIQTNRERMSEGKSPIDSETGQKIELHHMGQAYDSPLVELTENSEHGGMNHKILHDNKVESWRKDPYLKNQYNNVDRPNHWKEVSKGEF